MKIAAFDFDGTITSRDSFVEFIKFSKGKNSFYKALFLYSPLLVAFKLKLYPAWKAKQTLFAYFYKGVPLRLFNQWGELFIEQFAPQYIRPKAIAGIKNHQKENNPVIIVSASLENWILPWARQQGIERVLATQPEVDSSGNLTGKFSSANCAGKEKVNRILEVFPNRDEYELWAYGDSKGDKAMIEFADKGWYNKFR